MVLDTSLLNTQQYKVRIKGKVEQSKERSSTLNYSRQLTIIKVFYLQSLKYNCFLWRKLRLIGAQLSLYCISKFKKR